MGDCGWWVGEDEGRPLLWEESDILWDRDSAGDVVGEAMLRKVLLRKVLLEEVLRKVLRKEVLRKSWWRRCWGDAAVVGSGPLAEGLARAGFMRMARGRSGSQALRWSRH